MSDTNASAPGDDMVWRKKKRLAVATEEVERAARELARTTKRLRDVAEGKPCPHGPVTMKPRPGKADPRRPGYFTFSCSSSDGGHCSWCGAIVPPDRAMDDWSAKGGFRDE